MNFIQMDWKPVCEQLTSVHLNKIVLFDISLFDVFVIKRNVSRDKQKEWIKQELTSV